ncbi:MAG: L-ribulose-5-phosphate 4-epimerase AraD [Phycisphaerae bacterium]
MKRGLTEMSYTALKEAVFEANLAIVEAGLVVLTWGNASGVDRAAGIMAIKPSGVAYDVLKPADMVLVSLETGKVVDSTSRPSSDTPTHLELYRHFSNIGGIVHTHSRFATCFAQAHQTVACLGTTHADHFRGTVPVTRALTTAEIEGDYELNTGTVIVETFRKGNIDPDEVPAVLVANHAPFTWGKTPAKAVENSIVLEVVAQMNMCTFQINAQAAEAPRNLVDKHFLRKHGPKAYYGQAK